MDIIDEIEYEITPANIDEHLEGIEFLCRHSMEYRMYLKQLRESFDLITSPDFTDLNIERGDKVTIECHHLITLYRLCSIVATKMVAEADPNTHISDFSVSEEVMKLHMKNLVPTCLISRSFHELIHAGKRQLSPTIPNLNLGNYQEFIHEFHDYLTVEDYEKYISCGVSIENLEKGGMTCEIATVGSVLPV